MSEEAHRHERNPARLGAATGRARGRSAQQNTPWAGAKTAKAGTKQRRAFTTNGPTGSRGCVTGKGDFPPMGRIVLGKSEPVSPL